MKFSSPILCLFLLLLSAVITLGQSTQAPPNGPNNPGAATPNARPHKVVPGAQHTNNAGVKVDNFTTSHGDATIDPKDGTATSTTTVRTRASFHGAVKGLKSGDTLAVGSNNTADVEAKPGATITVGGGSTVTVTNTGTVGNVVVTASTGTQMQVPPGQTGIMVN